MELPRSTWVRVLERRLSQAVLRSRRVVALRWALAGMLGLVAGTAWERWQGRDPVRLLGYGSAAVLCGACALAFLAPGQRRRAFLRRSEASRLDASLGARGAVRTAAWLCGDPSPPAEAPRLAPLVFRDADLATTGAEIRSVPWSSRALSALLCLLALGVVIITAPGPPGLGSDRLPTQALTGPDPGEAPSPAQASAPGAGLDELAAFEIRTPHTVYQLQDPIPLEGILRSRMGRPDPVPLQVILGIEDGTPWPDRGLGPGVMPLDPGWDWTLPLEVGAECRATLDLRPHLVGLEMLKPGLIRVRAWARPAEEGSVFGGVTSNALLLDITQHRTQSQIAKPEPVPVPPPRPARREADAPETSRGQEGGQAPTPGEAERDEEMKRVAAAVKPLLSDAPLVEKEVPIFEREEGGPGRRPRSAAPNPYDPPEILRVEEAAIERIPVSPAERRLLRDYWNAVRKR